MNILFFYEYTVLHLDSTYYLRENCYFSEITKGATDVFKCLTLNPFFLSL